MWAPWLSLHSSLGNPGPLIIQTNPPSSLCAHGTSSWRNEGTHQILSSCAAGRWPSCASSSQNCTTVTAGHSVTQLPLLRGLKSWYWVKKLLKAFLCTEKEINRNKSSCKVYAGKKRFPLHSSGLNLVTRRNKWNLLLIILLIWKKSPLSVTERRLIFYTKFNKRKQDLYFHTNLFCKWPTSF